LTVDDDSRLYPSWRGKLGELDLAVFTGLKKPVGNPNNRNTLQSRWRDPRGSKIQIVIGNEVELHWPCASKIMIILWNDDRRENLKVKFRICNTQKCFFNEK
jgi:hypothetical protein